VLLPFSFVIANEDFQLRDPKKKKSVFPFYSPLGLKYLKRSKWSGCKSQSGERERAGAIFKKHTCTKLRHPTVAAEEFPTCSRSLVLMIPSSVF